MSRPLLTKGSAGNLDSGLERGSSSLAYESAVVRHVDLEKEKAACWYQPPGEVESTNIRMHS